MKSIVFPKGLKLNHDFSDYENEIYEGALAPKVLNYGLDSVLIFPDVFLYSELAGLSDSKLIEEWTGMAQKIISHLGGSEDIRFIFLSFNDVELSKKRLKWCVTNTSKQSRPVLNRNLLKMVLLLSNEYDYARLTKQLKFMSDVDQSFDYLEYLKSDEVLSVISTRFDDYKKVESLKSELSSCKESLSALETEFSEVNVSFNESNSLIQSQKLKLKALADRVNSREEALKSESEQKKNLADDNTVLTKTLEESESLIQSQESKLKELTDRLNSREEALKSESEQRKNLADDNTVLNKTLEESKSLIQSQESKLKELSEQHLSLEKAVSEIKTLNLEKNEMADSLEATSLELKVSRQDVETLTRDSDVLKASFHECLGSINTLKSELKELENMRLEKSAIEYDYEMLLASYSATLEKLQATASSLNRTKTELGKEKAKQAKQLQSIGLLERKSKALTDERNLLSQQNLEAEKELDKIKREVEALLTGKVALEEEYKTVKEEQVEKILKLEQESKVLFEQLTINQFEFAKQCDAQNSQIEQLKTEKKETLSKLIVAARDNTRLNSRLSKLKLNHNIVSYEKFLLENDSRYKSSIMWRAKSALTSVKNIRRKNLLETRKEDARQIASSEYFDIEWYLETYIDVKESGVNPAEHYLLFGAMEARMPSPKFDTLWYLERYPDVKESGINPLLHYIKYGQEEGRIASPKLIESVSFEKE